MVLYYNHGTLLLPHNLKFYTQQLHADALFFYFLYPPQVILLARLHEVHRAIVVTSVVRVYVTFTCASASHFRLKFFKSLYLLTMLMDQVDTLHVARYWSEVLRSTIMTHPG